MRVRRCDKLGLSARRALLRWVLKARLWPVPKFDLTTPERRKAALDDYWWNDHAFLRARFQNAYQISPRMWRANQPSQEQLAAWKDKGIKTIINLRGDSDASFTVLEKEACAQLGLKLVFIHSESRGAPYAYKLLEARELFKTMEYPAMMHCKSGADRAGMIAVFYLYAIEGVPLDIARQQLSLKYLHISAAKTGILDFFWAEWAKIEAMGRIDFWTWLETEYDRDDLKARFVPQKALSWIVDHVLKRE
jgi:protein tyrosine/serine phosphatase